MNTQHKPPKWANRLLNSICSNDYQEELAGDLEERFYKNIESIGLKKARRRYAMEVLKMIRPSVMNGDARFVPTSNMPMIKNFVIVAVRNLNKNRLFSTINLISLALSMSIGLLLISMIFDQLSFDKFHVNGDRIYRVTTHDQYLQFDPGHLATTAIPVAEKISTEFDGVKSIVRMRRYFGGDVSTGEKVIPMYGHFADENFLKVFSFPLKYGEAGTALKEPNSLVISSENANRLYGKEDVVGSVVSIDGIGEYTITGVLEELPRNSHMNFGALASFSSLLSLERDEKIWPLNGNWENFTSGYIYLELEDNSYLNSLEAYLNNLAVEVSEMDEDRTIGFELQALHAITPGKDLINQIGPTMTLILIYALSGLAVIIILSACFNYTNLSLARALQRSREVGIRKVAGGNKSQIFLQFIIEATVISLLSVIFSMVMMQFLIPEIYKIDNGLRQLIFMEYNLPVIVAFFVFAMIVGFVSGGLPAYVLSKVQPAAVLKGINSMRVFHRLKLRQALIAGQFTLSIFFIIFTVVVHKQYEYSVNFDLGFRKDNILNVNLQGNEPANLRASFEAIPEIDGISFSSHLISTGTRNNNWIKLASSPDSIMIEYSAVDPSYIGLHDISVLEGRGFIPETSAQGVEAIINAKLLELLGFDHADSVLGTYIKMGDEQLKVVGVMEDFHYAKLKDPIKGFLFRNNASSFRYANLLLNSSDLESTLMKIDAGWREVDQNVHPLIAELYEERIREAYSHFQIISKIVGFVAILAIAIATLGLLGMTVYTVERRKKEVGIRKVMGSSNWRLVSLLSRSFMSVLGIASLIASVLIYLVFTKGLFPQLAHKAPLELTDFLIGIVSIMLLGIAMIGSQTWRSARANPIDSIRIES